MAKKQTQTQTGALDVGAMYEAGAAGAVAKKSRTEDDDGFIKQLGRFALGYYMKSIDNLKAARKDESAIFATLDLAALDSDLTLEGVEKIKNKLTKSNKILNSARWSLFPNSDTYRNAEKNRTEALTSITNLKKQFDAYPVLLEQQTALANKTAVGKNADGNQVAIGFSEGSTALQLYNSSLYVKGDLNPSMSADENGNIVVNITEMEGPYMKFPGVWSDGKFIRSWTPHPDTGEKVYAEAEPSWDNPVTEKVETKEDIYGNVRQIKLDDMEFATAENAGQTNISYNHISGFRSFGMRGEYLSDDFKKESKLELLGELRDLSPTALADYLFKKDQWIDDDGGTMSVIEAQIREAIGTDGTELLKGFDKDEIAEILEDDQIDADEMYGIQELIKYNIKQGGYSVNAIADMIHRKGIEAHETEYKLYKSNNPKSRTPKSPKQLGIEGINKVVAKIKGHKSIATGLYRDKYPSKLIYRSPGTRYGIDDPDTDEVEIGTFAGGWYEMFYKDGGWKIGGDLHPDWKNFDEELEPMFSNNNSLISHFYKEDEWMKYGTLEDFGFDYEQ